MSKPGRPELLVICGPPAVGKMTVGQEVARITDFRLFHNHRIIDLLTDFFEFGSPPFNRVVHAFVDVFFDQVAESGLHLAFTMGWRFDEADAQAFAERVMRPFLARGGCVYVAELEAPLEVRLARNETENRRRHKKVDWATREHLVEEARHRWNTDGEFPLDVPHVKIENAALSPRETAERIRQHFDL